MLEALGSVLYTSQDADLLSALLNSWANLAKLRPATFSFIINTLRPWTPSALASLPAHTVKSVEKSVRILLVHLSRLPSSSAYTGQINETLGIQAMRMEKAAAEEKRRKAESKKRPSSSSVEPADNKRIKLEMEASSAAILSSFDFTTLPAPLITSLIVANLEAFTEAQLIAMVNSYRQSRGLPVPGPAQEPSSSEGSKADKLTIVAPIPAIPTGPRKLMQSVEQTSTPTPPVSTPPIQAEPVDPLKMDIDEEELEYEPEKLNEEVSPFPASAGFSTLIPLQLGVPDTEDTTAAPGASLENALSLVEFKLPPPPALAEDERSALVSGSITRIWEGADELRVMGQGISPDSIQAGGNSASEMWMLLLIRMITRVAKPLTDMDTNPDEATSNGDEVVENDYYTRQDSLRQTLCNYIMADFPSR